MFVDSHAHLDDRQYDEDRHEMLMRAKESKISYIVNVGYDIPSSERSIRLAREYEFIYSAVGIHPHDVEKEGQKGLERILDLASDPKVVAIGEIGLDYYRDLSPRDIQQEMFRRQIQLAVELQKPIIVHDRDAHGDVMKILREEKASRAGGVLHCFSGSTEMARECLDMGFYISIAGPVTFNNAKKLRDVVINIPLERMLIETDSPYLAPEPHRGKRNESAYVVHVARKIAELKDISVEDVARATINNAIKLFDIQS